MTRHIPDIDAIARDAVFVPSEKRDEVIDYIRAIRHKSSRHTDRFDRLDAFCEAFVWGWIHVLAPLTLAALPFLLSRN